MARTEFAKNHGGEPTSMALLAWRGARGLGALRFEPVLGTQEAKLEAISATALARGAEAIERGEPSELLPQLARGGTAGGVWPKALVLAYADGTLRVGEPDGEGVPCLLKFAASETGENARIEYCYALMARAAGVPITECRLLSESPDQSRQPVLLSRFDVPADNARGDRRIARRPGQRQGVRPGGSYFPPGHPPNPAFRVLDSQSPIWQLLGLQAPLPVSNYGPALRRAKSDFLLANHQK